MNSGVKQIDDYFPRALLTRFGSTVAEAGAAADGAVERFISILERLGEPAVAQPVAPGKWTPLGYAEHLLLVTEIWSGDVTRVVAGGSASRHDRGFVDADGNLVVTVPGAEPGQGRPIHVLVADLRAATRRLVDLVVSAEAGGFAEAIVHVNPYFGELTPLGCLQLAATHAHHHRKRHLLGLLER